MEFVFHSIKKLKKDIDVLQDKKPLILSISKYRKTCLNWTLLWPAFAFGIDKYLSANWTFSLLMSAADKVWITYWPWSTEILGQFIIRMCQFIGQYDVKHIMTSLIETITSVLTASTDIITNIPAGPIRLTEILVIRSVSTFKIAVILYTRQTKHYTFLTLGSSSFNPATKPLNNLSLKKNNTYIYMYSAKFDIKSNQFIKEFQNTWLDKNFKYRSCMNIILFIVYCRDDSG